jgi:large subunit ribosomal protein L15
MDLSTLKYAEGSRKKRKRIGRGGAHGGTSTRGHKGQLSRAGAKSRLWFEGGQMPIQRRLPKRGFKNIAAKEFQIVNLAALSDFKGEITPETLLEKGLIKKKNIPVKILGHGDVKAKLSISANAFSQSAKEKIEAAGGRVNLL